MLQPLASVSQLCFLDRPVDRIHTEQAQGATPLHCTTFFGDAPGCNARLHCTSRSLGMLIQRFQETDRFLLPLPQGEGEKKAVGFLETLC
jgi:hypothetical protein